MFVGRKNIINAFREEMENGNVRISQKEVKTQRVALGSVDQLKAQLKEYRHNCGFNFFARIYLYFADRYQISKITKQIESDFQPKVGFTEETTIRTGTQDDSGQVNDSTRPRNNKGVPRAVKPAVPPEAIMGAIEGLAGKKGQFKTALKVIKAFVEKAKAEEWGYDYQYQALEALIYLCCFRSDVEVAFKPCFNTGLFTIEGRKRLVLRDLAKDLAAQVIRLAGSEESSLDDIEAFKASLKKIMRERNESYTEELNALEFAKRYEEGNITCLNLPAAQRNRDDVELGIWQVSKDNTRTFEFKRYTDEQLNCLDRLIDNIFANEEAKVVLVLTL